MYAVIFSAELKNPEQDYAMLAERLRELAIQEYGCTKFISLTEANKEISISYWPTLKHIEKWKKIRNVTTYASSCISSYLP